MQHETCIDSASILAQALEKMRIEQGEKFSIATVNLAELGRRTGISCKKLRRLQKNGFMEKPHGLTGRKTAKNVLTDLPREGIYNSSVFYEWLTVVGYTGGVSKIKLHMKEHKNLLPTKRQIVSPQGNRGRRYSSDPGESYQMD